MKKLKHHALILSILVLILAACQAGAMGSLQPGGPASTPKKAPSQLAFENCQIADLSGALHLAARCTHLKVLENRAAGSGRQIELNIAVIPAVSRSPAADPLFFIPGGPGEAATEAYPTLSGSFDRLRQKRDIVLVDQRGTGHSNRLECKLEQEQAESEDDEAATRAWVQACLQSLPADARFYTTPLAVDDLEQVRQALGYPQVNLYGASYGTRVALAYLRQYPNSVRSVILDGVLPMEIALGPGVAADAQQALDLIFARCAADTDCQAAFPELATEFQTLIEQLRAAPVKMELDDPFSGERRPYTLTVDTLANTVHMMSYASESAMVLPVMIHTAYQRQDFTRLAALGLSNSRNLSKSMSPGMRFTVLCSEDVPFFPPEGGSAGYLGNLFSNAFLPICRYWPRGDLPEGFKQPVRSDKPVLLISGEADPVTPPANAQQAARSLPNSLQIVAPGQGHINIFRGCIDRLAARFVEQGSKDGLDLSCVQDIRPLPFFLNPSGPVAND